MTEQQKTDPDPNLVEQPSGPWKTTEPDDPTREPGRPAGQPDEVARERVEEIMERVRATPSAASSTQLPMPVAGRRPDPLTDPGAHAVTGWESQYAGDLPHDTPTGEEPSRCPHCGGVVPSTHELLAQILNWLDGDVGTTVIHEAYARLFEAAPDLRPLFPDDIKIQEEKLFSAIVDTFRLFQAGDDAMERLNAELARLARSHTRFMPSATLEEYAVVKSALFGALGAALGDKLTERHVEAATRAFEYDAGMMLAGQATAKLTGVGRRRRTV